jgi:hypothetical protein
VRKLASQIKAELEEREVCAVYNSDLARVWPKSIGPAKRKQRIRRFAKEHELAVTFYDVGLCAIFEKTPRAGSTLAEGDGAQDPRRFGKRCRR